jgi:RHS repeat-associated protein
MQLEGRSTNYGSANEKYKFTGKERDVETGYDYFGARYYDSRIGRFMTIDNYTDKYPSLTPYQYAANNPVMFIDVNGDSVNVASIQASDNTNGTNYLQAIISDLQSQTGLALSVSTNGQLTFATDANGNAIIAKDGKGNSVGSEEARGLITGALSSPDQAYATLTTSASSVPAPNSPLIRLNPNEIKGNIAGSVGVDSRTRGFGMVFMHELMHSNVGGGMTDPQKMFGSMGPIINRENLIRQQLGSNYGQRLSYPALRMSDGNAYMPMAPAAMMQMNRGLIPSNYFIRTK